MVGFIRLIGFPTVVLGCFGGAFPAGLRQVLRGLLRPGGRKYHLGHQGHDGGSRAWRLRGAAVPRRCGDITLLTLVICHIAIENGHRNSGFTH